MKKAFVLITVVCLSISSVALADTFAEGTTNEFEIEFVTISGDASSANGTYIGSDKLFSDPDNNYRMGTYEITNDQWNKFKTEYGAVTGSPSIGYDETSLWTGTNVPANNVSWYEAAQFVNWLNTSTGHYAAYKFTGTRGTDDYAFVPWSISDTGYDASNPYRNSNAYYFLPTEDEWVKAGYWNGTNLQTYATVDGSVPIKGVDSNYYYAVGQPWDVGSGSQELNGTFDMMGNILEWMENPYTPENYTSYAFRTSRGGHYNQGEYWFNLSTLHNSVDAHAEAYGLGFRVASVIPEPATFLLVSIGAVMMRRRK